MTDVIEALLAGRLAILPTETVYGLAGRADLPATIERLRTIKGARGDKPFSIQVPLNYPLEDLAEIDERARIEIDAHWPGPLTLVLPSKVSFPGLSGTIGLRCPDHPLTQQILEATGPLAVPSANRSGCAPPRTYAEAVAALAPDRFVGVDGGPGSGRASRVVRIGETIEVLRP